MVHLRYIDLSLTRIRNVLSKLGNIQDKIPNIIHVAGTNGKGSTVSFIMNILQAHGHSVNVFTSPHLVKINERFRIKGNLISNAELNELKSFLSKIEGYQELTIFEAITVLGYLAFYNNPADFLIMEVGLGGRLDATNIIKNPILNVLTVIDYDHQNFLGNTLQQIAYEKAGIIKKNAIVVSDYQPDSVKTVFKKIAKKRETSIILGGEDYKIENQILYYNNQSISLKSLNLLGEHQLFNASLATVAVMNIKDLILKQQLIETALYETKWRGRLERVYSLYGITFKEHQEVYFDGAHNSSGAFVLKNFIEGHMAINKSRVHIVLGMLRKKDLLGFLKEIKSVNPVLYPIEIMGHDSYSINEIASACKQFNISVVLKDNKEAIFQHMAYNSEINNHVKDLIIICGSLYMIGNIMEENNIILN